MLACNLSVLQKISVLDIAILTTHKYFLDSIQQYTTVCFSHGGSLTKPEMVNSGF